MMKQMRSTRAAPTPSAAKNFSAASTPAVSLPLYFQSSMSCSSAANSTLPSAAAARPSDVASVRASAQTRSMWAKSWDASLPASAVRTKAAVRSMRLGSGEWRV